MQSSSMRRTVLSCFYIALIIGFALLVRSGFRDGSLKMSYKVNTCLRETQLMLASFHPERNLIYKIKDHQNDAYVVYLRSNKQWWYHRTVSENVFNQKQLKITRCPS